MLILVSDRGRARSFMEKLRFSYAAHISSSSLCSTSTGWNPLSSSPWNSVSEPQSRAWLPWQNYPFSDHCFFVRDKIRMIRIMNPILDSTKETHPYPLSKTLLLQKCKCQIESKNVYVPEPMGNMILLIFNFRYAFQYAY